MSRLRPRRGLRRAHHVAAAARAAHRHDRPRAVPGAGRGPRRAAGGARTAPLRELRLPAARSRGADRGRGGPAARRPAAGAHRVPRTVRHRRATSAIRRPPRRRSTTAGWIRAISGYRADGELFVTGRRKDIIMKAGRNLYPQEVEEIVGATSGHPEGVRGRLRRAGSRHRDRAPGRRRREPRDRAVGHGCASRRPSWTGWWRRSACPPDVVVIAEPRSVLKTSSGKIRRERDPRGLRRGDARAAAVDAGPVARGCSPAISARAPGARERGRRRSSSRSTSHRC